MGQQLAIPQIGRQTAVLPPPLTEHKGKRFAATAHLSITEIRRSAWTQLVPRSRQSWDYYAAGERMSARGFSFGAIAAYCGDKLVGAVPMFRVDYRLDEPLGAPFQTIG